MHIHVGILNRRNGLDMIQPKALGYLSKVRCRHRIQEPWYHLLNRPGLLLRQFMYHGCLCDALDINVMRCLPGTKVRGGGGGVVFGDGLGGMRPSSSFAFASSMGMGTVKVWLIDAGDGTYLVFEDEL